ncbi:MAG: GFA family protein, partial [SAR324 cluster bacterium]|nr:GFA family protein [SAR324 cluster bacterium]
AAWSATPINSYSFWRFDQLEITKGLENIQTFSKTNHSKRKFCKKCGGHIMTEHPSSNLVDVFAVILEDFSFKPSIHVNYESKTISVKDGLPKFKDLPEEFNGSGEVLPE